MAARNWLKTILYSFKDVFVNGIVQVTRPAINLIAGTGITLTPADNPAQDRLDITVDAEADTSALEDATNLATPDTLALRDGDGGCRFVDLTAEGSLGVGVAIQTPNIETDDALVNQDLQVDGEITNSGGVTTTSVSGSALTVRSTGAGGALALETADRVGGNTGSVGISTGDVITSGSGASGNVQITTGDSRGGAFNGGNILFQPGTASGGTGGRGSIALGSLTPDFAGGRRVIAIVEVATAPTGTPSGNGILYVESGALKYKGTSGTVTTIAPA